MDSVWKELCDECPELQEGSLDQQRKQEEEIVLDFTNDIRGNNKSEGEVPPPVDICIAYSPLNGVQLAK